MNRIRTGGARKNLLHAALHQREGSSDMDDIDDAIRGAAQRNRTALTSNLSRVSQKRTATLIGISEGAMSVMKERDFDRIAALIAALDLKLVPITHKTFDASVITAYKTLAAIGLGSDLAREDD